MHRYTHPTAKLTLMLLLFVLLSLWPVSKPGLYVCVYEMGENLESLLFYVTRALVNVYEPLFTLYYVFKDHHDEIR